MTLQGQLAESANSANRQTPSAPVFIPATPYENTGLLGNAFIQARASRPSVDGVIEMYARLLSGARVYRLTVLKRQKFTPEGRQARIQASLSALYAPQPTKLTLAQWKSILEEDEDED
jgi:hypothetical protein